MVVVGADDVEVLDVLLDDVVDLPLPEHVIIPAKDTLNSLINQSGSMKYSYDVVMYRLFFLNSLQTYSVHIQYTPGRTGRNYEIDYICTHTVNY